MHSRSRSLIALFFLALVLVLLSGFSVARGCRRGGGCASGGCGPAQFAQDCPQCAGFIVLPPPIAAQCAAAAGGCNCSDGCPCDAGACPCKLGKEPCSPDCKCLLGAKPAVDPVAHPGVLVEHAHQHGQRYRVNGRDVTRREAFAAVSTVPDDRNTLSLTFAGGTDAERAAAVAAVEKIGLAAKCLVQSLPADSPLLKSGFVTSGNPTVYLQAPNGKVLARRQDASPASLQFIAEQVTAYDPAKDPQSSGPTLADLEKKLSEVPAWAWLVGGVLFGLYLRNHPSSK